MGTETFGDIDDLVATNPVDSTDTVASMGAHIRGIKSTLQTDFPNITGPATATQTDLNLLTGQEGIFLNAFFADGAGSVNAITADFTPNVSLTDGVTVMVKAVGAITSTTPTFAADGLTAKTITKRNGVALVLEDIPGSDATLILQYDTTLDNWLLLNPHSGGVGPDATGFFKAGTKYIVDDSGHATLFDIATNITTWESIGPTGSSATNIWTAMDNIPSTATAVIIRIQNIISGSTNADHYLAQVDGRATGSAIAQGTRTTINSAQFYNRSGSLEDASSISEVTIPLDSSLRFDLQYAESGTTISSNVYAVLVGFIA